LCSDIQTQLLDMRRFTLFYRFVFFMCREQGQKSICKSTVLVVLRSMKLGGSGHNNSLWPCFSQLDV
jgi:DCN1-like protein 1/2